MSGSLQKTETEFWNAVRHAARALRLDHEAWMAEKRERRLWESCFSEFDQDDVVEPGYWGRLSEYLDARPVFPAESDDPDPDPLF